MLLLLRTRGLPGIDEDRPRPSRYQGRRYLEVHYAAPGIQSRLSPEMESEVGRREIQDERQTAVQTERK